MEKCEETLSQAVDMSTADLNALDVVAAAMHRCPQLHQGVLQRGGSRCQKSEEALWQAVRSTAVLDDIKKFASCIDRRPQLRQGVLPGGGRV